MNSRRAALVLILMLAATVALAALVVSAPGSYIYEQIVKPISNIFWVFSLLLSGTPQALFWGILLVVALVLFLRSLVVTPQKPDGQMPVDMSYARRPRLRHWVRQLLMSRNERYRRYLKEGLGRLALEVLAYQRGLTVGQYQQRIDNQQEQTPEVIVPFLEARMGLFHPQQGVDLQQVLRRLRQVWNRLPLAHPTQPETDTELDELVDFLEKQMDLE
jgi:4-amino-4-deoxy-L-arabinose transferase-like glycosyltransferase